jgi:hypothetical protein
MAITKSCALDQKKTKNYQTKTKTLAMERPSKNKTCLKKKSEKYLKNLIKS